MPLVRISGWLLRFQHGPNAAGFAVEGGDNGAAGSKIQLDVRLKSLGELRDCFVSGRNAGNESSVDCRGNLRALTS